MSSLLDDVAVYLEDAGLGTVGTTIFKSYMPDSANSGLCVLDTGGIMPDKELPTRSPTFQILVRDVTYTAGLAKIDAIRDTLHQIKNATIGNTFFYYILAQGEGGHIGRNERGLDEFSMNFLCLTH